MRAFLPTIVLGCLVLSACSSDAAPKSTTTSIGASSTTTVGGTSSTAVSPGSTVASTVPATSAVPTTLRPSTTSRPATSAPGKVTTTTGAPATSAAPPPAATTTTMPAGPATTAAGASSYRPTSKPNVPTTMTAPIDPAWVEANGETLGTAIADGTYWASATGAGEGTKQFITFHLVQAFFGATCTAQFADDPDACDNDYGTLESPSGDFPMFIDAATVSVADATTQKSYAVSGDELYRLVGGGVPADDAPAGYSYVGFAYLVTVHGGAIVKASQVWTP